MILSGGKIINTAKEDIERRDIFIKNGCVAEKPDPGDKDIVDVSNQYLIYGMHDPYTYLGIAEEGVGYDNFDLNESSSPLTPQISVEDAVNPQDFGIKEAKQWGVTSFIAVPGSTNVIAGMGSYFYTNGKNVMEMVIKSPCCLKVNFGRDPIHFWSSKDKVKTRMGRAAMLREELTKALAYEKKTKKKERNPQLEVIIKVLNREIPVFAVAHKKEDIATIIHIKEEFGFNLILLGCEEGDMVGDLLKRHNIPCILGPLMRADKDMETVHTTFKSCHRLQQMGIKIALSHAHSENPVKLLRFLAIYAHKAGLNKYQAIAAVNRNAYEIIGDNERGSFENGNIADIAVFDGHPLDYKSKVKMVVQHGKITFKED